MLVTSVLLLLSAIYFTFVDPKRGRASLIRSLDSGGATARAEPSSPAPYGHRQPSAVGEGSVASGGSVRANLSGKDGSVAHRSSLPRGGQKGGYSTAEDSSFATHPL